MRGSPTARRWLLKGNALPEVPIDLSSLPTGGPLRVLALSATVAMLALAAAIGAQLLGQRWRLAARAALPFVALAMTFAGAGWLGLGAHTLGAFAALLLALWNTVGFSGVARWSSLVGAAGITTALIAAHMMFGG